MYDKSIAGEHRTYAITVTNTPTLVYDLLSPGDKLEYDNILNIGIGVQPIKYPSLNADNRYRTPVDGYVVSTVGNLSVGTSISGANEIATTGTQYVCPVYFWPHKTWVSASGPTASLVRIFFS